MSKNIDTESPDIQLDVGQMFDIDVDMKVPGFSEPNEYVPNIDQAYRFDKNTTLAILAGFSHNRLSLIHI